MSRPLTPESRAALLAAIQVHGFGPVLQELADEAERQFAALPADHPDRDSLAQVMVNLNMAAGEAAVGNL